MSIEGIKDPELGLSALQGACIRTEGRGRNVYCDLPELQIVSAAGAGEQKQLSRKSQTQIESRVTCGSVPAPWSG